MDLDPIKRDFASFSDPTTPVTVIGTTTTGATISWVQARKERSASLVFDNGSYPRVVFDGRTYEYHEFFASVHMADLRALAEMLQLLLPKQLGFVGQFFVEPQLQLDDSLETGPAFHIFVKAISALGQVERTRLLFLRGRAGDGKSALLVHMANEQAKTYIQGQQAPLYLYLNAQGSALARIDEVVAKTLQDFRAQFTYHAIATLTRLNLLIPIIDGFDELLGVGGYKDAFSSLAVFISRLSGQGTVIASARSSFYQYTNFAGQASRFATDDDPLLFNIVPITLNPWGRAECDSFLKKKSISRPLSEFEVILGTRREEILSSPFLFSQLVGLGTEVLAAKSDKHIVRLIVEELVRREMQEKLLDPQGRPLLTIDQHIDFLGMIAEEMWWQETREIDESTFTTLADLVVEEFRLAGDVATRFRNRVPSYALLTRTENPLRIGFRHEFYFAFFLGTRIASFIVKRDSLTAFLARSTLTTVISEEVAQTLEANSLLSISQLASSIPVLPNESSAPEITRTNLGVLHWGLIKYFGSRLSGSEIKDAVFNGLNFRSTKLKSTSFQTCIFNQCDLVDATWEAVKFLECTLTGTRVSERTKLVGQGLRLRGDVIGLTFQLNDDKQRQVYALPDVGAILERLGMRFAEKLPKPQELSKRSGALIVQLEQFLRIPERTLYFSDDDFSVRGLSLEGDLRDIMSLLNKHGLLVNATQKHRRGKRRMFRLAETPEIIRQGQTGLASSKAIQSFWNDLLLQ